MTLAAGYFENAYAKSSDPWSFRTRWYEQRKRAIALAMLPRWRFSRAFEPGCSNGELTVELAARCDEVLATDCAEAAVGLARQRVWGCANVKLLTQSIPNDWPRGKFDLIVISEVAYYLDKAGALSLTGKVRESLGATGVLLACHWRHRVADYPLTGDAVHSIFAQSLALPLAASHIEQDFVMQMWTRDGFSVARREGLV